MTIKEILDKALDNGVFISVENGQLKYKARKGTVPQGLLAELRENKNELIEYLLNLENSKEKAIAKQIRIDKVASGEVLQLSNAQQRLWLIDQIEQDGYLYNIPISLEFTGELNIDALVESFKAIIDRHQVLRTVIKSESRTGELFQDIQTDYQFSVPVTDLSDVTDDSQSRTLVDFLRTQLALSFDLSSDLMIRVNLIKLKENKHVLLVIMHHIASDGWSQGILIKDFMALYQGFIEGKAQRLPELAIQYADYANWQRNWLQDEVLSEHLNFWREILKELPEIHQLPCDRPRPTEQTYVGASISQKLSIQQKNQLNVLARQLDVTLHMVVNATFAVLLARHSNETDIVFGIPIANRENTAVASLVGFFINVLVMRSDLSDNPRFETFLQRTKEYLLNAYEYQQLPFEVLVDNLQPERSLGYSPLFQIKLDFHNNEKSDFNLPGLTLKEIKLDNEISKYDLSLDVYEQNDGITLIWEYATALFNDVTIQKLSEHFELLLEAIISDSTQTVAQLPIMSRQEKEKLLSDTVNFSFETKSDLCIHEYFEEQVTKNLTKEAVVFERSGNQAEQLTYYQLNEKSNQVAYYLIEQGVKPDTLVALCVERSLNMIVGILGILKAGGAYVPIDPKQMETRAEQILDDSNAAYILTESSLLPDLPLESQQILLLDNNILDKLLVDYSTENVKPSTIELTCQNLAYVIYTSGSTGKQKGVTIEHRSLVQSTLSRSFVYDSQPEAFALISSFAFDSSIAGIFWTLTTGGKLCIPDIQYNFDLQCIESMMLNQNVTHMLLLPSVYGSMLDSDSADPRGMSTVIVAGEECSKDLILQHRNNEKWQHCQLMNEYGPTEACVWSSVYDCSLYQQGIVPIGVAPPHAKLYVLDKLLQLCPVGTKGELYIGGTGLARNYHNQPKLTQEKFITNPFVNDKNERLYKSGDLVRWLFNDGNPDHLEFYGRIDNQLKIRGFRIEPGEIEACLLHNIFIAEAVVVSKGDPKYLVAYITPANKEISFNQRLIVEKIFSYLKTKLPVYMMPNSIVLLEKLPRTWNGKVNRSLLPEPTSDSFRRNQYVEPKSEIEKQLVRIWQSVLGLETIGVEDDFFKLGGHSLSVLNLVTRMNKELNANIRIKDIYSSTTIKALVEVADFDNTSAIIEQLKDGQKKIEHLKKSILNDPLQRASLPENYQEFYPLSAIQQSMVYFAQLRPEIPLYHDQMPSVVTWPNFKIDLFRKAVDIICQRHPILRTSFDVANFEAPMQIVHETLSIEVGIDDISDLSTQEKQKYIDNYCAKDLNNKFHFSGAQGLWRLMLFGLGENKIYLMHTVQHAILDGWSVSVLRTELFDIYEALAAGKIITVDPLESSYRDYVAINLERETSIETQQYWQDYLKGFVRTKLPFNFSGRARSADERMLIETDYIDAHFLQKIKEYSENNDFSIKEVCLSAHVYLLSLITGGTEILTGVVTHDRPALPDVNKILGCFLNTIPLRIPSNSSINKQELLCEIKQYLRSAKRHDLFLSDIARLVNGNNPPSNPLFDTIFNFTDFPRAGSIDNVLSDSESSGALLVDGASMTNTLFDLEIHKSGNEGIEILLKYLPKYFDKNEIGQVLPLYKKILVAIIGNVKIICSSQFVNKDNCVALGGGFNQTDIEYNQSATLHSLFENRVAKSSEAIAIKCNGESLSYRELNQRANQVSRLLVSKGVKSNDFVGVIMERSFELIISLLGILKSGAAYVPMEPSYPLARKKVIEESAKLLFILVDDSQEDCNEKYIRLNDIDTEKYSSENLERSKSSQEIAYVIYTSGSTGNPKGVRVAHHSAVNLLSWVNREFEVNSQDKLLFITSVCFDLSVYDIFGILEAGGTLVISKQDQLENPSELFDLMCQEEVTFWDSVPSTMNHLVEEISNQSSKAKLESLRLVFMSGDWIPVQLPEKISHHFPIAKKVSLGGATEGTVWSNYYIIDDDVGKLASIPYGTPIDNNRFYILDSTQNPVIDGVAGELYIGGVGVADGYQNDELKTSGSFFDDKFVTRDVNGLAARMYKTGDLGRILPDGNMEILGRIDHQVKLRGFRIELGEIESILNQHSSVKEAITKLFGSENDNASRSQFLIAYVVLTSGHQLSTDDLTKHLSVKLPEYMIPKVFIKLDSLPLNQNGKIDRAALPDPYISSDILAQYVAPVSEIEIQLCKIWQDFLYVEKIGTGDNFFELGGDSLVLMKIASKIRTYFSIDLRLQDLFEMQTIADLSTTIEKLSLVKNNKINASSVQFEEIEW